MKTLWLLYDDADFSINRSFAQMMHQRGEALGMQVEPVLLSELTLGMDGCGCPICLRNGNHSQPDAVLSRQRDALISRHFEAMGVPVFNNSRVCALCNDKRVTHQFLHGLPMLETNFLSPTQAAPAADTVYPVVLKPACSHGGDRVLLVQNEQEWREAAARILPEPAIQQAVASHAGRDLRVYVLHGQILAGVMRAAQSGIVSNFKQGGHVALHELTSEERALAQAVIRRFEEAGATLHMAGVDFLYHQGRPVVSEVEDVVGSRMLYQTSNIDIAQLYLQEIARILAREP